MAAGPSRPSGRIRPDAKLRQVAYLDPVMTIATPTFAYRLRSHVLALALLLAASQLAHPPRAEGQAVPAAYGFISGSAAGLLVTTGIFVAKARAGSYLYSLDDMLAPRWEIVPAFGMPIGAAVLGIADEQRLASSVAWGAGGFAVGALAGYGVGALFSDTDQGKWAGAIIGAAAGVLAGSIYGVAAHDGGDPVPGGLSPGLTLRIPVP